LIERLFQVRQQGSSIRVELAAGATTFVTMAYILFVNPLILADAGMDQGAVFVATCLAAAIGTAIMAIAANYPIAPGMGTNAFFTYGVVIGLHLPWQTALGAVFLSGLLFWPSALRRCAPGSSTASRARRRWRSPPASASFSASSR
jgi:AGZA family xanthine/uracil permease-like MFS transporter